jgi:hypothetical protein
VTSDNTPRPDDAPTEPRRPGQAFTAEEGRAFAAAMVAAYRPFVEAMIEFGRQAAAELAKLRPVLEAWTAEMQRQAAEQNAPTDGPSVTEDAETPLPGTPVTLETIQGISAGSKDFSDRPIRGGYRITAVDGGYEVICYPLTMKRCKERILAIENADELQRCTADHEHHWRNAEPLPGATSCEWETIVTRRDLLAQAKGKGG